MKFYALLVGCLLGIVLASSASAAERLRLMIETDAGGDPDDEQSLVRFLLYASEWDIEGIIANRPQARDGENKNPERTGLGIVRRMLAAYGQYWTNLVRHDFRARLDWCVADRFNKANHRPLPRLNGDGGQPVLFLSAKPGQNVTLSAAGSTDPDGDDLQFLWFSYPEPTTFRGEVFLTADRTETITIQAPRVDRPETIHLVLQVEDAGKPPLYAYRRAVIRVDP